MDVTNPLAPRICRFIPFAGNKDVGQKVGAPHPAPWWEFPLMLGEETTDPVPCAIAVVGTPLDAAWDSKGATMYYRATIIMFCDSEGQLRPCNVKMPIAINCLALD